MIKNPILDELHETRQKLLDEAGGTLEGLVAALQKRQQESGRTVLEHTASQRSAEEESEAIAEQTTKE